MEVYDRYHKAMYNTALRILNDRMEAEDVMQESFLAAFTKLHTYKGEVAFGAWLKRIVVNNSIGQHRKRERDRTVGLDGILYKVADPQEEEPENEATKMKAKRVLRTMQELKDNYRVALTLFLIEGYDYGEIGKIMGMSYGNCRTTISRAKESLRKKLINDHRLRADGF